MNRNFLFMSGEPSVSSILAFSNPKWEHTSVPTRLVESEIFIKSAIRRENRPREALFGIIHYADVDDKLIEIENLKLIIEKEIKCWPNPKSLLNMTNRHDVLRQCQEFGLVDHDICQSDKFAYQMNFPFVLKTGTSHRGIDKYLINSIKDIPKWEGIATMEPFFEGESVRILIIGQDVFSFKVTNELSWIKNSPGADMEEYNPSSDLINHATDAMNYFQLDVAGVDYIVEEDGTFHFLEINQYPGLGVFEHIEDIGREFIKNKMYGIEMSVG